MRPKPFDLYGKLSQGAKVIGASSTVDDEVWYINSSHQDQIDLAVGMPTAKSIPFKGISNVIMESLNTNNPAVLQYDYGRGYDRLRYLLNHEEMGFSDYSSGEDNFILFNGSSGCMENFCSTFVDPDDIVIVEGPSFPGTVGTILKH